MPPCTSSLDTRNGRLCDAIEGGDALLAHCTPHRAYRTYIVGCQFGKAISLAGRWGRQTKSCSIGMKFVAGGRGPFEVVASSIRFVTILMVGLRTLGRWRAEKRNSDESVYRFRDTACIAGQSDARIAAAKRSGLEDSAGFSIRARTNASYAAKIADLVPAFVTNNRAPFFGGRLFEHRGFLLGVMRAAASTARPLQFTRSGTDSSHISPAQIDVQIDWRGARV